MQASSCRRSISITRSRDGSSTFQRSVVRQARRVEQIVGAGDARRPFGPHQAVGAGMMRPAQDPELGEPGQVRQLPGDRVELRQLGHPPLLVAQVGDAGERDASALAQRGGERCARQCSRVQHGWCSSLCTRRMPRWPDDPIGPPCAAARLHRLAGAGRREQRQLAHGAALAALPARRSAEVTVDNGWRGEPADALIALHARRSAPAVESFHDACAGRPLALVLTGTDLYRDLDPAAGAPDAAARRSVECASHLVVLQHEAMHRLDAAARARARVIVQSASALRRADRRAAQHGFRRRRPSARREGPADADARGAAAGAARRRAAGPAAAHRPHRRRARRGARPRGRGDHAAPARATAGSARCRMPPPGAGSRAPPRWCT